jgi:hypothetical protein
MEPWTRGIRNAVAAFTGGDAIEARARTREEQRILAAANQRALLDDRILRAQGRAQELKARDAYAELVPDELQRATVMGGYGPGHSAYQQARLREFELARHQGAFDAARAGDPNLANANVWGITGTPQAIATVQGDMLIPNRLIAGGGDVKTTPKGEAAINAKNAQAKNYQANAARQAAITSTVGPLAEASIAHRRAQAAAQTAIANTRGSDKAGVGGVTKPADVAAEAKRAEMEAASAASGDALLPDGQDPALAKLADEVNRREYEAAARSDNPEAFHVADPKIDPTVRTTPAAPTAAVVRELMAPRADFAQARGRGVGSTAPKPPVKGAKLAPDGKWYVQRNGKFYPVVD